MVLAARQAVHLEPWTTWFGYKQARCIGGGGQLFTMLCLSSSTTSTYTPAQRVSQLQIALHQTTLLALQCSPGTLLGYFQAASCNYLQC